MDRIRHITVVGLGYVGRPLAIALARRFRVVGFDRDPDRVYELNTGTDRTGEANSATLRATTIEFTSDAARMAGSDVFIIAAPTPIDDANRPDLTALRAASRTVGGQFGRGAIVVIESTVYLGVTEEICEPELEAASRLRCGEDFFLLTHSNALIPAIASTPSSA